MPIHRETRIAGDGHALGRQLSGRARLHLNSPLAVPVAAMVLSHAIACAVMRMSSRAATWCSLLVRTGGVPANTDTGVDLIDDNTVGVSIGFSGIFPRFNRKPKFVEEPMTSSTMTP
jgi:hypothetical protein